MWWTAFVNNDKKWYFQGLNQNQVHQPHSYSKEQFAFCFFCRVRYFIAKDGCSMTLNASPHRQPVRATIGNTGDQEPCWQLKSWRYGVQSFQPGVFMFSSFQVRVPQVGGGCQLLQLWHWLLCRWRGGWLLQCWGGGDLLCYRGGYWLLWRWLRLQWWRLLCPLLWPLGEVSCMLLIPFCVEPCFQVKSWL